MRTLLIQGGTRLKGSYRVQGNKNAALPILAASLLARQVVNLHNLPRIGDVDKMLALLQSQGAGVEWRDEHVRVDCSSVRFTPLLGRLVEQLRGAILLAAPIAAKEGVLESNYPGGCPIGARTFEPHWEVFRAAGFEVLDDGHRFKIERKASVSHPVVYLGEASVTATENALVLFASLGSGTIHNPAREPHVDALAQFLSVLGAEIDQRPNYLRVLRGVQPAAAEIDFHVQPDFVDAGTLAIAAAATRGSVLLSHVDRQHLIGIEHLLSQFGVEWNWKDEHSVEVNATDLQNPSRVVVGLWPGFPTDLSSLAIVLATQGSGSTLIHDWMYESRMFFVDKLVRMGARITLCDPHRVVVQGPTSLRAITLESPDIRAGMALIVAGLVARGQTRIEHAEVVFRGYEHIVERLNGLGAMITEE